MVEARRLTVVDDDESVRESLPDLLRSHGFVVAAFESAEAFLASQAMAATDCLILDIAMPGMTGPQLQRELSRRGLTMPIVFITARSDEAAQARVIERGAYACLIKPFGERAMLEALNGALRSG